jgi:DNA-binding response OmpR family regulator
MDREDTLKKEAPAQETQAPCRKQASLRKKILVVEDDFHSREALRIILFTEGYGVETCGDGLQAINKMKEDEFGIAIIDINLPPVRNVPIDGWDLIRITRAFNPAISIIVVSGEKGVKERAEQFRVSAFLEKPISPAQLKATLTSLDR